MNSVGLAIDRQTCRYRIDIAVPKLSALVEERRIVQFAQITCKSQLQFTLNAVFGLRDSSGDFSHQYDVQSIDVEDCDLPVNEKKDHGGAGSHRKRKKDSDTERRCLEKVNRPHGA